MRQPRLSIGPTRPSSKDAISDLVKSCRYGKMIERCASHPHEVREKWCRSDWFPKAYHRGYRSHSPDSGETVFDGADPPRTVLHAVCADGHVPADVVIALLVAWPEAASLQMKGTKRTPLHNASCVALDTRVLQALFSADPSSLFVSDVYHRTPLAHLCHTYSATLRQALENYNTVAGRDLVRGLASERAANSKQRRRRDPLCLLWTNASVLVKEISRLDRLKETTDNNSQNPHEQPWSNEAPRNFYMVHECISIGKKCPKHLLALSTRVHPEQFQVCDDEGRTPLHVVCKQGDLRFLTQILYANLNASTQGDHNGFLPLHHLAIRVTNEIEIFSVGDMAVNILDNLIGANPEALTSRENSMNLAPFMLAATTGPAKEDQMPETEEKASIAQINAIYHLLRSSPTVCRTY